MIRDALLIDGTGRPPQARTDMLLRGGLIERIGPAGSLDAPQEALVVDGSGKSVVPGIINLLGLVGLVRSPEIEQVDFGRDAIVSHLGRYASYGVTAVAALGPDGKLLGELRKDIATGRIPNTARVLAPLRVIGAGGNLADRYPLDGRLLEAPRSRSAARRAVNRLAREGADLVECWHAAGKRAAKRSLAIALAVIRQARQRGIRAAVRTSGVSAATSMVRAGAGAVIGSVNDREIDAAFVSAMLSARAVYAPALFSDSIGFEYGDTVAWLDDRYLRRSLPSGITGLLRGQVFLRQALDPDRALKRHRFDIARRNLIKAAEAGIRIGLASGSGFPGSFEGYSEYREAVLMKRAGMAPLEIVRAFSQGSAAALGIEERQGALVPGRAADIVMLNGNPLDNIHYLRELHAVFIRGKLVKL